MKTLLTIVLFSLAQLALTPLALAHAGNDERLKILVADDSVLVTLSLDGDALPDFDANHDGELQAGEFKARESAIADWIDSQLVLVGPGGERIAPYFSDMPIADYDSLKTDDIVHHVRIVRRYRVATVEKPLRLRFDLFAHRRGPAEYVVFQGGGERSGYFDPRQPKLIELR